MGSWPNDTPLKVAHQQFAGIIPEEDGSVRLDKKVKRKDNKGVM